MKLYIYAFRDSHPLDLLSSNHLLETDKLQNEVMVTVWWWTTKLIVITVESYIQRWSSPWQCSEFAESTLDTTHNQRRFTYMYLCFCFRSLVWRNKWLRRNKLFSRRTKWYVNTALSVSSCLCCDDCKPCFTFSDMSAEGRNPGQRERLSTKAASPAEKPRRGGWITAGMTFLKSSWSLF